MKRLFTALLASTALLAAVPAVASAHDNGYGNGYYNNGNDWDRDGGYNGFRQEFGHLYQGVQHGLSDGSINRWQARRFFDAIADARQRLEFYRRNDGYLSPWEQRDMQARLQRLHEVLHVVHERDHEREDGYGYDGNNGYGGNGYDRNGYGDGYNRDDGGYRR